MKLTKEERKALNEEKKAAAALEQAKRDSFLAITGNGIKFHMEQLRDDDSRLDFLTDIFMLTEDYREEIRVLSESSAVKKTRLNHKKLDLRGEAIKRQGSDSDWPKASEANTGGE